MKVYKDKQAIKELAFPALMVGKASGDLYLVLERHIAGAIRLIDNGNAGNYRKVGYTDHIGASDCDPYTGPITMENDYL